ncbi:MAG: lipoyl synthase [Candidatus Omnitrophica bacterium]|nr:lipoyl synthase [Candidatus Omnitrophota bacterium]
MKNSCNQKTSARNCEVFRTGLPDWFKQEIPSLECLENSRRLGSAGINTVCVEAKCPNLPLCFKQRKLTFMILGLVCTRSCRFCAVCKSKGLLPGPDETEPQRIAEVINDLKITYAVITSVCRDDLDDGGASQFSNTIKAIRKICPAVLVEILIPDFQGKIAALKSVLQAQPVVIGHNIETVSRLYRHLRPEADYWRSLELLRTLKQLDSLIVTKSSLMLGLSETEDEVISTMKDLRSSGCDILILGQYLAPSPDHEQISEFISPERFLDYRQKALTLGFKSVLSGPLVRSSFEAERTYRQSCL